MARATTPIAVLIAALAFAMPFGGAFDASAAGTAGARSAQLRAQLGDNEVCGTDTYLGRIETGAGYTVGQQITVGAFTIEVTSVKDGGEITGFTVVGGSYDYFVVHAGQGQTTSTGTGGVSGLQFGLSFVAFCASGAPAPTNTPVAGATETPVVVATNTPVAGVTETPVAGATETPVNSSTAVPTQTGGGSEGPAPTQTTGVGSPQLPSTGQGAGSTNGGIYATLALILLAVLAGGVAVRWRSDS